MSIQIPSKFIFKKGGGPLDEAIALQISAMYDDLYLSLIEIKTASSHGIVTVFPPSSAPSNVLLPDGEWLDVSASTTHGLQEAINEACAVGGYDLEVVGGYEPTGGAVVYNISSTLKFPAMQGKSIRFGACTLNCNPTIGAGNGVEFDSCMMVDVDMSASQIVYNETNTGSGLAFKPDAGVPLDHIPVIIDSRFRIGTVASAQSSVAAVNFDYSLHAIIGNSFDFLEVNGGIAGIKISDAASIVSGRVFNDNFIRCPHVHGFNTIGLAIGHNTTSYAVFQNTIEANLSNDGVNPATYMDVWGYGNTLICNFYTSAGVTNNIIWQSTSYRNNVITNSLDFSKITNSATTKNNRVTQARSPGYASISPSGSPYVLQNLYPVDNIVVVTGGTVSAIDYSGDGSNYYSAGSIAGSFPLPVGMYLRVTYSSAPTMHRFY